MADTLALQGAPAPVLAVVDGVATTTSTDVARHFGKQHAHVIRAIELLRAELPAEALSNFGEGYYTLAETGAQQHKLYRLTRDGFTLLAMGFTGKRALAFKLAYIQAFNRMETELAEKALAANAHAPSPVAQVVGDAHQRANQRSRRAFMLAERVAASVSEYVFECAMREDDEMLDHARWTMGFVGSGDAARPHVQRMARGSVVMAMDQLPRMIADPDRYTDPRLLAEIAAACAKRLERLAVHGHPMIRREGKK